MNESFYDIKNISLYNLKIILENLGYSKKFINEKSKEFLLELLKKNI
jgi:hypothetical protein